jgi:predicted phosphodiesterase
MLADIQDDRIKEIVIMSYYQGINQTSDLTGLSAESIARYRREFRNRWGEEEVKKLEVIERLQKSLTLEELQAISKGSKIDPTQREYPVLDFEGEKVKFAHVTDTHIGSKYFDEKLWKIFLETCYSLGVEKILHTGDVTEGLSNRPDHAYSLTHYGFDAQKEFAIEKLAMSEIPIYCIDGNHDRWFIKSNGANIVKDICSGLDHCHYLGHDEADIEINGSIWRLWHGEDGSSYATSYRLQKIVESFTGGDKPNVLLAGHTHKQGYFFDRNIHVLSGGALSLQSKWMRSKKLANHTGFHTIEATIEDGTVKTFSPTWHAFFI